LFSCCSATSCPLMPPLQFDSCLLAGCCVAPVLHRCLFLSSQRANSASQRAATSCLLFAELLSCCIFLRCLHLMSPFVALPPHLSIFNLLPSFAPAGCCVTSCRAAYASCPLINAAASCHTSNSTSRLPLACPDWLPYCL
jgi:hypothetical protein